jgi:uncharacterized membrane protein YtjA (UPF0391 family)
VRRTPILGRNEVARGVLLQRSERDRSRRARRSEENVMLHWAIVFFVVALLAAVFGFGGLAASAAGIAKIFFFIFLVLAVLSLLAGRRGHTI